MAFDRYVRLGVSFEIVGREQGERLEPEAIVVKLRPILTKALASIHGDDLTVWDAKDGRISLNFHKGPRHVAVERIEDWTPAKEATA